MKTNHRFTYMALYELFGSGIGIESALYNNFYRIEQGARSGTICKMQMVLRTQTMTKHRNDTLVSPLESRRNRLRLTWSREASASPPNYLNDPPDQRSLSRFATSAGLITSCL